VLKSIAGLCDWCCKDFKMIYKLWRRKIMKEDESDGDLEFTTTIGLKGKSANYWKSNKDNLENGEEYARLIKTPYQNLMLDKWVLRTKERPVEHRSFLPQEVVWWDVWTRGFQRRHSSRWWYPWRDMQLTIHSNERMQYTSQ
jgi:hypothetical protein